MHSIPSIADMRQIREYLNEIRYSEQGLIDQVRTLEAPIPQLRNLPRLLHLTQDPTPLNRLIRWFLGGLSVPIPEAKALFPTWFLELSLDCGLLTQDDERLTSQILIEPHGEFLVAADTYWKLASTSAHDYVLPLNPTARFLLNFTVRRAAGTALDLGTGCGIQALAAAAHSSAVVATDLNPRATRFAAFNAQLNGQSNIECVTGDLFHPVADQRFDLIVSNPPFVLAPSRHYLFRDNELGMDRLCQRLVREAPRYLNEGGYFQMLFDWVQVGDQPWQERLREWFSDCGCDVFVVKQYSQEPLAYAQVRLREMPQQTPEEDNAIFREWMAYYDANGVKTIHGGLVAMRKRRGHNNWICIEEQSSSLEEPFGAAVLQRFANRDYLSRLESESSLSACRLRLAPDVALDLEQQWTDGHWRTVSITLCQGGGLYQTIRIDGNIAGFLEKLDGEHTLGELIAALSAQVNTNSESVRAQVLATMELLLRRGFLLPN